MQNALFLLQITKKFSMSNKTDTPIPEEQFYIWVAPLHPKSTPVSGEHSGTRLAPLYLGSTPMPSRKDKYLNYL